LTDCLGAQLEPERPGFGPGYVEQILNQTVHQRRRTTNYLQLFAPFLWRQLEIEQNAGGHKHGVDRIPQVMADHGQDFIADFESLLGLIGVAPRLVDLGESTVGTWRKNGSARVSGMTSGSGVAIE
jgi:hypothetical protein